MIAVIDYGMGNIHSVKKALELYGADVLVTDKPEDLVASDKVILPGVGAFNDAISELENNGLAVGIRKAATDRKPILGICLGMQLLFERSEESNNGRGLGLLKGRVKRFPDSGLKVPHMGWNSIKIKYPSPIFKDVKEGAYVYFCHSYYPCPNDSRISAVECDYGINFTAAVWQENIYGVQFHPEKSQDVGLKIIENFARL